MNDRVSWFSPSRVVAVAVLASIPAKSLADRIADPDLWWHLRTGKLIVATHHIPHSDVYSYTVPGRPWVAQEWLSEVILHGIRKVFGLWGIFFWRTLMLTVIYLLVARLIHRRMGEGMGTWALAGLTAYAGGANWTERPNLFSFLLFVVMLTLLDRRDRSIWFVVPLAALWANLHGMVILGIGTLAMVAITEGIKVRLQWERADAVWAKRVGLVALAGAVATLANPRGPELIAYSFRLVRVVSTLVTEWASPDFHEAGALIFLALLLVTIASLAFAPGRPDLTDIGFVLAFTVLGLQAARNLAIASIVLGVVTARYMPGALSAVRPPPVSRREATQPSMMIGVLGLVVALGGLGIVVASDFPRSDAPQDIVEKEYPVAMLAALNGRSGSRVFAFDVWADYLIDQSWPGLRVYHDTRVEVYGLTQTGRYQRTIAALPGWDRLLDESCTTHVLVRPLRDPLAEALRRAPGWRVEREEKRAILFARTTTVAGCPSA